MILPSSTSHYPTLDALGFHQGKKMMQFWAKYSSKVARAQPETKSTISLNTDLPIYTIPWPWLRRFSAVNQKYKQLLDQKLNNSRAQAKLMEKYASLADRQVVTEFNTWLQQGLIPQRYIQHHKHHQAQYIEVKAYPPEGLKANDLLAALAEFNLYAFYRGYTVNIAKLQAQASGLASTVHRLGQEQVGHLTWQQVLKQPNIATVIIITHVGIYAGDIYEFNDQQYLGTWDIIKHRVSYQLFDHWLTQSDTDDQDDLSITNETFSTYRQETGMGRDFLALSAIDLVRYPMLIKINQRGEYVP